MTGIAKQGYSLQVPGLTSGKVWLAVIVLALSFRLAVFGFAIAFPIANENGALTSPLHVQTGTDITFFQDSLKKYSRRSPTELLSAFVGYYGLGDPEFGTNEPVSLKNLKDQDVQYFLAPPVFPLMLGVFEYGEGNTLPLALAYLLGSCALVLLWLHWLRVRGLGAIGLSIFAVLPNPVWFAVSITSDLPFSVWFAGFFLSYTLLSRETHGSWRLLLWITFVGLCILTRPNGVSVVLFIFADLAITVFRQNGSRFRVAFGAAAILVAACVVFFMAPHFLIFSRQGFAITYFGVSQQEYLVGIFEALPLWIDQVLSWLALAASKVLYFVGLRPTYGTVPLQLVLVRSAAGLILLPGLVFLFFKAPIRERVLVTFFLAPLIAGASQDRYNLPIQPILFFWGAMAWKSMSSRFVRAMQLEPSNFGRS